jgi:hypothetical protein
MPTSWHSSEAKPRRGCIPRPRSCVFCPQVFQGEESIIQPALQGLIRAASYEENSVTVKALPATRDHERISTDVIEFDEQDIVSGDVMIAVDSSTVNYKKQVALTGRAQIIERFQEML